MSRRSEVASALWDAVRATGRKFVFVIDEWDAPVHAVADQVLERDYPQVLRGLGVPILVVAVTYDAKTKAHSCRIFEA